MLVAKSDINIQRADIENEIRTFITNQVEGGGIGLFITLVPKVL